MQTSDRSEGPIVWDLHAHYLPEIALDLMHHGQVQVKLETIEGKSDSITVNGMPVGATIHQLARKSEIVEAADRAGIDRRVLSPPPFTYRYWDAPDDTLRLHRTLNDATAAMVAEFPDRFVGLATVPLQDTDAAIAEATRAREQLGLVGVTLGTNVAGGNVDDPVRRPFLASISEAGMPVLVHPDFVPNPRMAHHYLINLLGMPVETAITMSSMIFSGLFVTIPDLRVCFVHGGGAAPYLMGRWNRGWHVRTESRADSPAQPSDVLRNVFCDTLTHSPLGLSYLVELLGETNVVIGSDAPFDVEDADPRGQLRNAPRLTAAQIEVIETVSPVRWLTGKSR